MVRVVLLVCIAAMLYSLDAFLIGVPFVGLVGAVWGGIRSIGKARTAYRDTRKYDFVSWSFGAVAFALVIVALPITFGITLEKSRQNAEEIVAAVRSYRNAVGEYPEDLSALVPRYAQAVPRAGSGLLFSRYYYSSTPEGTALMYVEVPPFGRRHYSFDDEEWRNPW